MRVRYAGLALLSVCLCACSTLVETSSSEPVNLQSATGGAGLGPQSLAAGDCGLFGWDTSAEPDFVFFATAGRALYMSGDGAVETITPSGLFPATEYGSYKLTLGAGEPLVEGMRYASARMTNILPDGYRRVRPLVILETCQAPEVVQN